MGWWFSTNNSAQNCKFASLRSRHSCAEPGQGYSTGRFRNFSLFLIAFVLLAVPATRSEENSKNPRSLPFPLDDALRLSAEDLADKKEGSFLTGLPQISSDPLTGFGLGIDGILTFNGTREDPFFGYTPFRWELESEIEWTTQGAKNLSLKFEAPYAGDTPWNVRVEGGYNDDPTPLFFGITQNTLNPLSYQGTTYSSFESYSNALEALSQRYYNGFHRQAGSLNLVVMRSFAEGTLRLFGGLELNYVRVSTYDGASYNGTSNGPTLLSEQSQNQGVLGVGANYYTLFQAGIAYDTRDLAPDPNRGTFVQLTTEYGPPVLGSQFDFLKFYFSAKNFLRLFPETFSKLILASHLGFGTTSGRAPFYEYMGEWSSDNDVHGLGGRNTLRGYKLGRFVGPLMGFANFELRYRFLEWDLWKQHFGFNLVPFFDIGRVWNRLNDLSLNNLRTDFGLGLRMAWNLSTVISADYAISGEDRQFFLEIGNAF